MALLEALMARTRVLDSFAITRILVAILLSLTLLISPLWATPSAAFGTVVFANRARVGGANASAGATLFSGDRLSTDEVGSVQVRAGAARADTHRSPGVRGSAHHGRAPSRASISTEST